MKENATLHIDYFVVVVVFRTYSYCSLKKKNAICVNT